MPTEFRKKTQKSKERNKSDSFDQIKHNALKHEIERLEESYSLEFGDLNEIEKLIEEGKITPQKAQDCLRKIVVVHEQKLAEIRETNDYIQRSKLYGEVIKIISLSLKQNFINCFDDFFAEITRKYVEDLKQRSKFFKGVGFLRASENLLDEIRGIDNYQTMIALTGKVISNVEEAVQELRSTLAFRALHNSIKDFVTEIIGEIEFEFNCWEPEDEGDEQFLLKDKNELLGKAGFLFWNLQQLDGEVKETLEEQKRLSLYPDEETYIYMEEQGRMFDDVLPNLIDEYGGKYVYFENGKILDSDEDVNELTRRVCLSALDKQIFIERVPSKPIEVQPAINGRITRILIDG